MKRLIVSLYITLIPQAALLIAAENWNKGHCYTALFFAILWCLSSLWVAFGYAVGRKSRNKANIYPPTMGERQNPHAASEKKQNPSGEHICFRAGYWKLNVYLDGELIHSFDDRSGDILATLQCFPGEDESDYLDELIDAVQTSLESSRQRKLTNDEIKDLKRKMIDTDNLQNEMGNEEDK